MDNWPIVVLALVVIVIATISIVSGQRERAFERACLEHGGRVGHIGDVLGCYPEDVRPIRWEGESQ